MAKEMLYIVKPKNLPDYKPAEPSPYDIAKCIKERAEEITGIEWTIEQIN